MTINNDLYNLKIVYNSNPSAEDIQTLGNGLIDSIVYFLRKNLIWLYA